MAITYFVRALSSFERGLYRRGQHSAETMDVPPWSTDEETPGAGGVRRGRGPDGRRLFLWRRRIVRERWHPPEGRVGHLRDAPQRHAQLDLPDRHPRPPGLLQRL